MPQTLQHAKNVISALSRPKSVAPNKSMPATSQVVLNLYRSLLREISYLPPAISANIHKYVTRRFHQNQGSSEHIKQRTRRANNALRTVRAANNGDKKAMVGLIHKSFGRTWIRRHELMTESFLLEPEVEDEDPVSIGKEQAEAAKAVAGGPQNTGTLKEMLAKVGDPDAAAKKRGADDKDDLEWPRQPKRPPYERFDIGKLKTLLRSQYITQKANQNMQWPVGDVVYNTAPEAKLPPKTVWGKPMPEHRKITVQNKFWRRSLPKIMPPVGDREWQQMGKLARGDLGEKGQVPQKRMPAQPVAKEEEPEDWDWERYVRHPISVVEKGASFSNQRRSGDLPLAPHGLLRGRRPPSDRWFRRQFEQTWRITPLVEEGKRKGEYDITWGGRRPEGALPTRMQLSVFEGVDAKGQPLKK